MNYQDIQRVNGEITMLPLKGKDYAMVPERVTAFRKLFPDGFITTDIMEHDGTTVLMKAICGYYEDGERIILGTGYAQEVKGKGMVNSTSYIENCETSAVGRALGFLGLGINGGGICSAEELANAVVAQRQMQGEAPKQEAAKAPAKPEAPREISADQYRKEIIALAPKKGVDFKAIVGADYNGNKWDQLNADDLRDIKQKLAKRPDADK